VVKRGQHFTVSVRDVPTELHGPIPEGAHIGTAVVRLGGSVVAEVPLVTATAVAEASFMDRFKDANGPLILGVVIALALVGSLLVMGLRRRAARRRRALRRRER